MSNAPSDAPLPAVVPAETAKAAASAAPRWEFAAQVRAAWRAFKWVAYGALALTALLVLGQIYLLYEMASELHRYAGWAFLAGLAVAVWFGIGRPLIGFLRRPSIARPPAVDLASAALTGRDAAARARFNVKYLTAMRANPELANVRDAVQAALVDARALEERAKRAGSGPAGAVAAEIAAFEHERIEPLLKDLDHKVDRYIHREAVAVGAATAASLNGTVDAFLVLWRNVNMISRVARFYFGRPDLRGTLVILRDVAAAIVLARALDDLSEMTGELVGGVLGKLGGAVAGPLMDGSINAAMTLKLGYLAKKRCRSFEAWSPEKAEKALVEAFRQVKAESGSVVSELVKACGGIGAGVANAANQVGSAASSSARAVWGVLQSLAGKKPEAGPEETA